MAKNKILVVDDEVEMLQLMSMHLQRMDYEVIIARDQKEAIEALHKEHPPVVFLDILLGNDSGIEVLRQIKKIDKNTKVFMLTALEDEEAIGESRSSGADFFISKHTDWDVMMKELSGKLASLDLNK
ncbi:MAG: response regulator [Candidatus Omnitrophica bacterium]|nr:response regulator [Candidatus Omnitrophota bacterium]